MTEFWGTGRHLEPDELRLWTGLLDASRILETELAADLVGNHDMTHREYEILVRLDGGGGELRMSELAGRIEASGPLITQTIKRLEQRGWVARRPVDGDGRGVRAVLLPSGREALADAAGPHAEIIKRLLLSRVPVDVLPAVAAALGEVADHLRRHRAGEGCADPRCPLNGC